MSVRARCGRADDTAVEQGLKTYVTESKLSRDLPFLGCPVHSSQGVDDPVGTEAG